MKSLIVALLIASAACAGMAAATYPGTHQVEVGSSVLVVLGEDVAGAVLALHGPSVVRVDGVDCVVSAYPSSLKCGKLALE